MIAKRGASGISFDASRQWLNPVTHAVIGHEVVIVIGSCVGGSLICEETKINLPSDSQPLKVMWCASKF